MGALPGRDRFLSIDIKLDGKLCSDHVTLYLVSLGLAVTTENKGKIAKNEINQSGPTSVADPRIDKTRQIACQYFYFDLENHVLSTWSELFAPYNSGFST
jgi:hypothetical protein